MNLYMYIYIQVSQDIKLIQPMGIEIICKK